MPSWGIHLAVANKLTTKLEEIDKKNKDEFLLSNILPDINNGYVVKEISQTIEHKNTHYETTQFKGIYTEKPGYIRFYEKYKNNINNPVILGYFTHLATDYYFNTVTYVEHGIFDENNNRIGIKLNNGEKLISQSDKCRQIKANDFKVFSFYLYKNEKLDLPEFKEKIIEEAQNIDNIKLTKSDIYKTVEYLNKCQQEPDRILDGGKEEQYTIYTREELENRVDKCVEFIKDFLNNK